MKASQWLSAWMCSTQSSAYSTTRFAMLWSQVAAGSGVLALPMRRRGLDWRTTEPHPWVPEVCIPAAKEMPVRCDALSALSRFGHDVDVVFWSWWEQHPPLSLAPRRPASAAILTRISFFTRSPHFLDVCEWHHLGGKAMVRIRPRSG